MTPHELDDSHIAAALARMWDEYDPVPDDLADRIILGLALDQFEVELLTLIEADHSAAGARSVLDADDSPTLTFSNGEITVMVALSPRPDQQVRIDGWVEPAGGGRVEIRYPDGVEADADVDADGRFVVDGLSHGLIRLKYTDHTDHSVAAPPFEV